MITKDYRELVNIADCLVFLSENELFFKIIKDAGYDPDAFEFKTLFDIVASAIYNHLTS